MGLKRKSLRTLSFLATIVETMRLAARVGSRGRPAGEKVAPKDRNGLVKAKLPTVMRKLETLAKETGGAYLLLYHHEAPTKAGKMEKRYILEGTRSFCKLLGKPKGDGTYEVLEPVVAAAYAFKFGDSSAEVAELRRMDATDFSNEKQVKAAALELLKRLLVIQLSLPEKRSVGQPFKLYSNARNSDPELPQVPKGWPTDAAVSFNSDCFHNRTTRKTANAIYNSIRMELISVLEAKDNGGSQPVKPHPKVTMPARMITGAIRNISSRAAATGAQAESEAAPQTGRGDGSAAAAVDGTYVPTGILAAGGPSARVQAAAAAAAAHGTADEDSNGQARQPRVVNFGPPLSEDEEEADGPTTEQPLSQRGRKWQQQQQQLKRKLSSATDGTGENELKEATEEEGDGGVEGRTRGAGHKKKRVPPRVSAGGSSFEGFSDSSGAEDDDPMVPETGVLEERAPAKKLGAGKANLPGMLQKENIMPVEAAAAEGSAGKRPKRRAVLQHSKPWLNQTVVDETLL